jgi:hypothetical protein
VTTCFLVDQPAADAQRVIVDEDPNFRNDQTVRDIHSCPVVAEPIPRSDQDAYDAQVVVVASGLNSRDGQASADAQSLSAISGPLLADPFLALAADVLDDLEKVRIANENRLRQLTRNVVDSDGEERGFGLSTDHPDVKRLAAMVEVLGKVEHDATLNLQRMMRKHPLGPWIKAIKGVGDKQGARLLACIGDPYWNDQFNRPCTVSELWAYCGYHVLPTDQNGSDTQTSAAGGNLTSGNPDQGAVVRVAASRVRGQKANWSTEARTRARLIAISIVRSGGPYREVYDQGREKYANAVHTATCRNCGSPGKPAPVGSELSDGHKHARALRLVSKAVLRDLWREAKRLHEE